MNLAISRSQQNILYSYTQSFYYPFLILQFQDYQNQLVMVFPLMFEVILL